MSLQRRFFESNIRTEWRYALPLCFPLYILPGRERTCNDIATCLTSGLRTSAVHS